METIIEILVDNSNSMGPWKVELGNNKYLLPDGGTRMELAKKILLEVIIPELDYADKIAIRKFHSVTINNEKNQLVITPVYKGLFNKSIIFSKINDIEIPFNTGGTPITAAVKSSIEELAKSPTADRKIILITDGHENLRGDYKQTIEDVLRQHGNPCNIFIVGIAQDAAAEEKSKGLALSTGGSYFNLKAKVYDKSSLRTALRSVFFNAINSSIQNIASELSNTIPVITKEPKTNKQEVKTTKTEDKKEGVIFSEIIQKNVMAFNLLSKQLLNIAEAIDNLKKVDNSVDEEISITENPELNESIRLASESYLFDKLKDKFGSRVKWLNETQEGGLSHDFEVLDTLDYSIEYYIECKASTSLDKVFYMTKGEWCFFLENKSKYQVYFISNALSKPQFTKIDNLWEWIMVGNIVPWSNKDILLKAERIIFRILK